MKEGREMKISELEAVVLLDLCFARQKVLGMGNLEREEETPLRLEVGEFAARQTLTAFDFFRCAWEGNEKAIRQQARARKRGEMQAGGGYYDGMIDDYCRLMTALMEKNHYTLESSS